MKLKHIVNKYSVVVFQFKVNNLMKLNDLRKIFLGYFESKGHTIVKSSSLIPHNDPTLLFTNAGMNQFKDVFLGLDSLDYVRATSSQKCVRAGGKHNDLENVGYTARHHTFFEMLGNFSFGDYFKLEAIQFAWEFLTVVLKIPADKLYVTVYKTDDAAFDIWNKNIGLATDRIIKIGDNENGGSDNFWQMGDTGPCGPCTEIFYDHGAHIFGGLPGTINADGDRYVEIWNCVFMQFNRDEKGILHPLPKPSVDTGMGLERIAAVMQNVHSNYEIDLFANLIQAAVKIIKCNDSMYSDSLNNLGNHSDSVNAVDLSNDPSLKVLADHIRSISFLIADRAEPSNEGRGYVLRRIIRRAVRHGYKLGPRVPFLHKLVDELVIQMGEAYPELVEQQQKIEHTILQEEHKFFETISAGMNILHAEIKKLKYGKFASGASKLLDNLESAILGVPPQEYNIAFKLDGATAFKLYDTYGFPLDLTGDICREHGITVDIAGFDVCMQKQKDMARAAGKFKTNAVVEYSGDETKFSGYTDNSIQAVIVAIYCNNQQVDQLSSGEEGVIVLNQTVFYAQGGGQVGDTGVIEIAGGAVALFSISDTQKIRPNVFGHIGRLSNGCLKIGDNVTATYDLHQRLATARNHSATHLLHKALHEVVGVHAVQKGSLVCSEYTRFDFANDKPLTASQIEEIERIVNHVIMMNYPVIIKSMPYEEAIKNGAMALFGEKYTDEVRVIQMGGFSTELCGGTHVARTGDIGFFSITSESGIANGIRRIEAITGETAVKQMQKNMSVLDGLRSSLKAQNNDVVTEKVAVLVENNRQLNRTIDDLKAKIAILQASQYLDQAELLPDGCKLLVLELADMDNKTLVELTEQLKNKLGKAIVVLGCKNVEKVNLVVGVTKELINENNSRYKAGDIVNYLAALVGGKGGGRADLAQAGGSDVAKLSEALSKTSEYIRNLSTS